MAVRTLAAAILLLPLASVPMPVVAPAADDPAPAPVLKFRTELGGGDTNWAQSGVYAPDGKTLYTIAGGGNAGLIYVIDPVAGQKTATLKTDAPADANRGYPTGHAISPDGKYLAVAYNVMNKDYNAAVKEIGWELVLWDLAARKVVETKRGHDERWYLTSLKFSPDGKRLAGNAAGYDKKSDWFKSVALVWDVPGLAQKHEFSARGHAFHAMGFARDGDKDILQAAHGGPIYRWDLATGKALETLGCDHAGRYPNGYAAFSPDGKTFAALSDVSDNNGRRIAAELRLFDAQKGGKARAVARGHKGDASGVTFSRDSKKIATGSYSTTETVIWDADNLAILATIPTVGHLAWSPDGETLAISGIGFWSPDGHHLFTMGRHMAQVWAVAVDPKGKSFVSAQNMPCIHFWEAATLRNHINVSFDMGGRSMTKSMAYSPDGRFLAIGYGKEVKFLDTENGKVKFTAEGHTGHVSAVAFSSDGKHFASAAWSVTGGKIDEPKLDPGEVIIWEFDRETAKAKPVHTIKAAQPAGTFSLAFSPDGKTLATGGGDSGARTPFADVPAPGEEATKEAVRLWDVPTGKKLAAFPCDPQHHVNALVWSPDGKTIAHTGIDGTRVRLLDPATGKERRLLQAPTYALAFSPDGSLLATVGHNGGLGKGLVELWDMATGEKIASEMKHEREVNCVAFTPNGRAIITGDSEGVLNLWDVNPPKK